MMRRVRHTRNTLFKGITFSFSLAAWLILLAFILGIILQSRLVLSTTPLKQLLLSTDWSPLKGEFGFLPFIMGTVWVTVIAVALAAPVCVLAAVFLSEYAHQRVRDFFRPVIDVLAGIPSVVYGLWGVILIVPFIKNHLAPWFGVSTTGYTVLAAGIVLAVMIAPVIINITLEVLHTIPRETLQVSLSLGATKWQAVKIKTFRRGLTGILAGIIMALSRAFGETMAVLMVAGNVIRIPRSVFDPGYPLPALIANSYGEMLSIPRFQSALLVASLILMVIVLFFNLVSYLILHKLEERLR